MTSVEHDPRSVHARLSKWRPDRENHKNPTDESRAIPRKMNQIASRPDRDRTRHPMRTVTALALAALCFLAASHPTSALECDEMMTGFHDNDVKSQAWQDIAHGNVQAVRDAIQDDPCYAVMRAGDGRGPLFWAHEFYSQEIIDVLTHHGADLGARDRGGKRPDQMVRAPPMTFEAPVDDEEEYEYEPEEDDDDVYTTKSPHDEM